MARNSTTTTINEDSNDAKLPPIFHPIPARWGYLPSSADTHQQARSEQRGVGSRDARQKDLNDRLIACLVALPIAVLALVAICAAVVVGAFEAEHTAWSFDNGNDYQVVQDKVVGR